MTTADRIRAYAAERPNARPITIAIDLGVPERDVMQALAAKTTRPRRSAWSAEHPKPERHEVSAYQRELCSAIDQLRERRGRGEFATPKKVTRCA